MNNSKLFVSAICLLGLTLAAPSNTEAGRNGGGRGGVPTARGGGFARGGMGPYGARWNGGNWNRTGTWNRNWNGAHFNSAGGHWRNWNGRWGWWNGHRWWYPRNNVVFIGNYGFPWWWGWGWGPWSDWGGGGGYPYGYYGYGNPYYGGYGYPYYGYGNGYGNGYGGQYQSHTEIAASPELPNYNAGCNARVITMDPLTESWGHKRGAQSGRYEQEHGDVG